MKNKNSYKPTLIILGYQLKKHLHGRFKIVEFSRYSNEQFIRKKTKYKHLNLSDAEDLLFRLESKLTN